MYINRIDTSLIYRPFLNKAIETQIECALLGKRYIMLSGLRTYQEQDELYAQGRTKPGKIITKAKAGQSLHNFGIAIDFAYDTAPAPGLQPSWAAADYRTLADVATKVGLEAGLNWKSFVDPPHIQLPISKHGITIQQLDKEYQAGGYPAVFALLDKYKW